MCGIPEKFYTDHGSDFKSSHIEQVAADLKFELIDSSVGEASQGQGRTSISNCRPDVRAGH